MKTRILDRMAGVRTEMRAYNLVQMSRSRPNALFSRRIHLPDASKCRIHAVHPAKRSGAYLRSEMSNPQMQTLEIIGEEGPICSGCGDSSKKNASVSKDALYF